MRAVVQRVRNASVAVDGDKIASIDTGLVVLVGVVPSDTDTDADVLARKLIALRIFPDDVGKMNLSVVDIAGSILVVSQFTLAGDIAKGRRPSFSNAAHPDHAIDVIDHLVQTVRELGVPAETGEFGAVMDVTLTNWGPVTFVVDITDGVITSTVAR
ncbi:MAG: D-aminoacyl-tRNA deacylase [Actinomycetia bacterium]|nr:D-aminoacyl-tRNA deacylase [Actinomycetes bacterium]